MRADMHTHSLFSFDGRPESTVPALCEAAIAKGLTHLAITDHCDIDGELEGIYAVLDKDAVYRAVCEAKKVYADRLTLLFGIELGHQILALACGAEIYTMKFGHRGSNHAVKELKTGKVSVVGQNHSYAVCADSLKNTGLQVTYVDAFDNTVEGVADEANRAFSVQYTPAGTELYERFVALMEQKEG